MEIISLKNIGSKTETVIKTTEYGVFKINIECLDIKVYVNGQRLIITRSNKGDFRYKKGKLKSCFKLHEGDFVTIESYGRALCQLKHPTQK